MNSVIKDKYNFDLTSGNLNIKEIFFTIMTRIDKDPNNQNMTLIEKNKLTLKIVKEIIKTKINLQPSQTNRDAEVYPDRKPVYDNRQVMNTSITKENCDVSEQMKIIENSRKSENITEIKQLGDINKTIYDNSYNDDEFKNKMVELESNREHMNSKFREMFPIKDENNSYVEKRNTDI